MKVMNEARLSEHFTVGEFMNLERHPENVPGWQEVINMAYGCVKVLEPARQVVGTIRVTSGYRNAEVNRKVGGVRNSQHVTGCAADITCAPALFPKLIATLKANPHVDQLLTAKTWLHVSWTPLGTPRRQVIMNYYK